MRRDIVTRLRCPNEIAPTPSTMLYRSLALAVATVATVRGWNDCSFPDVGYFVLDEGVGHSYAYAQSPCRLVHSATDSRAAPRV